jgi:PST family polysaccharide transporter
VEDKAVRGVSWTTLSYAVNRGIRTVSTIALARLLSPEDFGLVALAAVTLGLINVLTDLGLGGVLVIRPDLGARGRGTVLTMMVGTGALGAGIVVVASPLAADALGDPRVTPVLAVLSATLVINVFAWFYQTLLQRELEFRRIFICNVVSTVVYVGVVIPLAVMGAGPWSLVTAELCGGLALGAALLSLAPIRIRPAFDPHAAREVLSEGWGFLVQGGLGAVSDNADRLVVGRALGVASLGFYTMAYRLGDLPYQAFGHPVATVLFPGLARMNERGEDVGSSFLGALRLVALVSCPVGVILSATAYPFTALVFGEKWLPMVGILTAFGIWAALRPLLFTTGWLLNALGRARLLASITGSMLLPFIAGAILAAAYGGVAQVAWVAVASSLATAVILGYFASRSTGMSPRRYWRALRTVVIACALCWIAAAVVADVTAPAGLATSLAASVSSGLIAYLLVVYLLEPRLLQGLPALVRRALGRAPAAAGGPV